MTNKELRELRERVTYYGVAGVPLPEEDTERVRQALSAYLNLRPVHASTFETARALEASS